MLKLSIDEEHFDESTQEFIVNHLGVLELEHSLTSLSKWESKFKKPFLSSKGKTVEETMFYISCMANTPGEISGILSHLTMEHVDAIQQYIESTESATTFGQMPETKSKGEIVTAELIYYWMVAYNIPFECEDWHLNRLFALVKICNIKNSKSGGKVNKQQAAVNRARVNEERKAALQTRG